MGHSLDVDERVTPAAINCYLITGSYVTYAFFFFLSNKQKKKTSI